MGELRGVARASELHRRGVSRRALAHAVASGELVTVGRGAYALPDAQPPLVRAVRHRASVTCASALQLYGWDLLDKPVRPHLSSPRRQASGGCVWHRGALGPRLADELTAAAVAVRCLPGAQALVVADQVLRRGWDRTDLASRVRVRGSAAATWAVSHADGRAESVLESALRWALLTAGVSDLSLQVQIPGVGRVDMVAEGWLVVEADGWGTHGTRAAFEEDRRRVTVAMCAGLPTVRVTWADAVFDPGGVGRAVREVLARGSTGHFRTKVTSAISEPMR